MFGLVWAMLLANLVFWVGFLAWDGFLQFSVLCFGAGFDLSRAEVWPFG